MERYRARIILLMAHPKEILNILGANAQKKFSQNFLTSPHWAQKLTDAILASPAYDEIWEIGPGLGALSEHLIAKSQKPVRLFEIDRKLAAHLREKFPKTPLIEGDFLDVKWNEHLSSDKKVSILSNLPYHLSSPLLFRFIEHKTQIPRLVLTFQKEFADRLTAKTGDGDFGGLTLICQLHFKIESLGVLPAGAFYPAPDVSSVALQLEPIPSIPEADSVTAIIKAGFAHRRKMLLSNLKKALPDYPWAEAFEKTGISPKARSEELVLSQFVALAKESKKSG